MFRRLSCALPLLLVAFGVAAESGTAMVVAGSSESAIVITGGPTGFVNSRSATFAFAISSHVNERDVHCALDLRLAGCSVSSDRSTTSGSATFAHLLDGPHLFVVEAKVRGQIAAASRLWVVDTTPPRLAPTVAPALVALGGTVVVDAHASDAGSGIAAVACGAPDTSTAGAQSVSCTATDRAGNSTSASASFVVAAPPTLTASATAAGSPYVGGIWTSKDVTVTFVCHG